MAQKKTSEVDYSMQEKILALYELQKIDSQVDEINKVKGELPLEVQDLEDEIEGLNTRIENINAEIEYGIEFGNYDEDGGCGDCCGDCSNCESREKSQKICDSLELLAYILGHLYDN